jgi:hypothetical protein
MERERGSRRGWLFIICSIVYIFLLVIILILVPVTIANGTFFTILNKSNHVELASAFDKITLSIRGHCVKGVDGIQSCSVMDPLRMFYTMPDFAKIPNKVSPVDIPFVIREISAQNPVIYIPLVALEFTTLIILALVVYCIRRTTRKAIIVTCCFSTLLSILSGIALGVAHQVYSQMLPRSLDKPVTVQVVKNGVLTDLTGKPSDVGIRFISSNDGQKMLGAILAMSILALFVNMRWIPEGNKSHRRGNVPISTLSTTTSPFGATRATRGTRGPPVRRTFDFPVHHKYPEA